MSYYIYKYEHPNNGIIYVGQSTNNINQRISSHNNNNYDNINRKYSKLLNESKVYYITLNSKVQTNCVEMYLIDKYKPVCNKQYKTSELCDIEMILPEWKVYNAKDFKVNSEYKPKNLTKEVISRWIQNDDLYDSYISNNIFKFISTRDNVYDKKSLKFRHPGWAKMNYSIPNKDINKGIAEYIDCINKYTALLEQGKSFMNKLIKLPDIDEKLGNKLMHGYFILNNRSYQIELTKYGLRGIFNKYRYYDNFLSFKKSIEYIMNNYNVYFFDGFKVNDERDNCEEYLYIKLKSMSYSILTFISEHNLTDRNEDLVMDLMEIEKVLRNKEYAYDILKDLKLISKKDIVF